MVRHHGLGLGDAIVFMREGLTATDLGEPVIIDCKPGAGRFVQQGNAASYARRAQFCSGGRNVIKHGFENGVKLNSIKVRKTNLQKERKPITHAEYPF